MSAQITQIRVGRFQVGIVGLAEAIAAVREMPGLSDAEIAAALFERLASRNYFPPGAAAEYKEAFLREYKRALGQEVPEPESCPVIRILGPGCPNCERLTQLVMELLSELKLPMAVEQVKDINEIASYGVVATPALLFDKEVKSLGRIPTRDALRRWLLEWQEKLIK